MDKCLNLKKKSQETIVSFDEPLLILHDDCELFSGQKKQDDLISMLFQDSPLTIKNEISAFDSDLDQANQPELYLEVRRTIFQEPIQLESKPTQRPAVEQVATESPKSNTLGASAGIRCKCSRSKCQKNYCECFKAGQPCGSACGCEQCFNTTSHCTTSKAKPRCRCKKSHCRKNYCQCHNSGQKCSAQCQCLDCDNMVDNNSWKIEGSASNDNNQYDDTIELPRKKIKTTSYSYEDSTGGNKENDMNISLEMYFS